MRIFGSLAVLAILSFTVSVVNTQSEAVDYARRMGRWPQGMWADMTLTRFEQNTNGT